MSPTSRNVIAVVAGMLTGIILSILTDFMLESIGVFPTADKALIEGFDVWWMLGLALFYRCAFTALGGYFTARIAADQPMKMVAILGGLAFIGNLIGLIATWNMQLSPAWYPIALTLLAFPSAWIGGRIEMD